MVSRNFFASLGVRVDRDGDDWVITVKPPRPSKKLNLEFLGDNVSYIVTVEKPLLPSKGFNWSRSEESGRHQSLLSPADRGGVRRCEVLASLEPQEHYALRVSQVSENPSSPSRLTQLYVSFTDESGHHSPIGFMGLGV